MTERKVKRSRPGTHTMHSVTSIPVSRNTHNALGYICSCLPEHTQCTRLHLFLSLGTHTMHSVTSIPVSRNTHNALGYIYSCLPVTYVRILHSLPLCAIHQLQDQSLGLPLHVNGCFHGYQTSVTGIDAIENLLCQSWSRLQDRKKKMK